MFALIAILVFVVVTLTAFAAVSLFDQRNAQARLIRERLASVDKAATRAPSQELALLRDEMLSKIPALDSLLRRSSRISGLQTMLAQADVGIRAGNILILCMGSALIIGIVAFIATSSMPPRESAFIRMI